MTFVAYAWIIHAQYRRLRVWELATIGFVVCGVVLPTISILRQDPNLQHLSSSAVRDAYLSLDNPLVASLHEMGSSMYTVTATLQFVPSLRPHDFGLGYVHAILNVVPNFVPWSKFDLGYQLPDQWLTAVVDPQLASLGGGSGFSFIAEAFLAFGWWGAVLTVGVIGALFGLMAAWVRPGMDAARTAAVASYLLFVLHFARGASESYTRQWCLYSCLPYACVVMMRRGDRLAIRRRRTPLC
jgi:hypothetical protein